ncbi:MAG TPA: hypothetical protein VME63_11400 [Dyella sp.]|uniref:hypothetical protein n=1 Tax=Dyella sp. TaxID=1869338 RepID=UPI002C7454A4|nr:hypothetical protein [Dyella sp.]HTV86008.1 hypothetical protein [Dyella sp.]
MDIEHLLLRLRAISDNDLRLALNAQSLAIDDERFITAFNCVSASHDIARTDIDFKGPPNIPAAKLREMRKRASVVFMAFTALCYMRSLHLERGLDDVPEASILRAFRDIYRAGSIKRGDDTLVQHIRNSLTHGTFQFERTADVLFTDIAWQESLSISQLMELCEHVHRLYHAAFKVVIPCPPNWSKYGSL